MDKILWCYHSDETSSTELLRSQGCCLTGARSPEVPMIYPRATKISDREPEWAP